MRIDRVTNVAVWEKIPIRTNYTHLYRFSRVPFRLLIQRYGIVSVVLRRARYHTALGARRNHIFLFFFLVS